MGYSTRYEMTWEAKNWKAKPLCAHPKSAKAKFCETCGKPNTTVALDDVVGSYIEEHEEMHYALEQDGSTNQSCKWYDHAKDLEVMSCEIPGVLFHLKGEGEEAGDIWDLFALDGKVQKHQAKIVRQNEPDPKAWGWEIAGTDR